MTLHQGSAQMAHNLDRLSARDFETIAGEAARLGVSARAVEMYMDLFGEDTLPVRQVRLIRWSPRRYTVTTSELPAYEAHIRQDLLGERLIIQH